MDSPSSMSCTTPCDSKPVSAAKKVFAKTVEVPHETPIAVTASDSQERRALSTSSQQNSSFILVYHCWICGAEFEDKLSIMKHLKEWHRDRPELRGIERKIRIPFCQVCKSTEPCKHLKKEKRAHKSAAAGKLEGEAAGNNGENSEDCYDDVNEINEEDEEDEDNISISHPRVLYCVTCEAPFSNPDALHQHRFMEHPKEKSYQCTYCPGTYAEHSHLVFHTRVHTGCRPYICLVCGSRFPKNSDLKRHARIHSGEKPFKCAQCNQMFTQKGSLEKHARIHAKRSGGHPCLMCGLVFKQMQELTDHATVAHKNVHWQCKTCGKLYKEERHLLLHEKGHHGARPHTCSYCSRTFASRQLLDKHEEKVHCAKPDIRCDECGKLFKRKENLSRHKQSHRGLKNYKCEVCGQTFTEKGSLTRHTKAQHYLLRPHTCLLCGRAFTRKILLRKHTARYHDNSNNKEGADNTIKKESLYFRCKVCKKLLRKSGMRQHASHHKLKGDNWEGKIDEDELEIKVADMESTEEDFASGDNIQEEDNDEEENEDDEDVGNDGGNNEETE